MAMISLPRLFCILMDWLLMSPLNATLLFFKYVRSAIGSGCHIISDLYTRTPHRHRDSLPMIQEMCALFCQQNVTSYLIWPNLSARGVRSIYIKVMENVSDSVWGFGINFHKSRPRMWKGVSGILVMYRQKLLVKPLKIVTTETSFETQYGNNK